jgi:chemotaxis signal transduction protein
VIKKDNIDKPTGYYLFYTLGGHGFCAPIECVEVVLGAATPTAMPVREKGFLGVLQVHEQLIPVFSGFELLGLSPIPLDPSQRIIVFNGSKTVFSDSENIQNVGLLVEDIIGVASVESYKHYRLNFPASDTEEYVSMFIDEQNQKYIHLPLAKYFEKISLQKDIYELINNAERTILKNE